MDDATNAAGCERPDSFAADPAEASERRSELDSDERAAWRGVVAIMCSLPRALDSRLQHDTDLTFFEFMVLEALSRRADRTLQMTDLATAVSASLSRLSHVVSKLEREGLLRRNRMPGAGRPTRATLTDEGYAKAIAALPGHVAAVRELLLDAAQPSDLPTLRRIGAAVDHAIYPERPGIHDALN